ncbi:MAG: response regulator transcription factor [Deltaproteobacteria bacterium]|nr:response regulator transcription factor [Deltaproteobacteria bacterium]
MDTFDAQAGIFFLRDSRSATINLENALYKHFDRQRSIEAYRQRYRHSDPCHLRGFDTLSVHCMVLEYGERRLRHNEFYSDFLAESGIIDRMVIALSVNGRGLASPVLFRCRGEPSFTLREKAKAATLRPYLSGGMFRSLQAERAHEAEWVLSASADNVGDRGLVVVDGDMSVAFANSAAREIFLLENETGGMEVGARGECRLPDALMAMCGHRLENARAERCLEKTAEVLTIGEVPLRVWASGLSGRFCEERKDYLVLQIERLSQPSSKLDESAVSYFGLSAREAEIAAAIAEGHRNAEIAERLFISIFTVEKHIQNLFRKVSVSSRTALVSKLVRR